MLVNLLNLMPWLSQVVDNDYDPKLVLSLQWEFLSKSVESIATDNLESEMKESSSLPFAL